MVFHAAILAGRITGFAVPLADAGEFIFGGKRRFYQSGQNYLAGNGRGSAALPSATDHLLQQGV
jgi:hypothetical protein